MKLVNTVLSQAVRLGALSGKNGGSFYGLNIVKQCEQRYGFLQSPKILADYDLTNGVTFLHGNFNDRFVIDRFSVYGNGFFAEAKVGTSECEEFLDDVMKWGSELGSFKFTADVNAPKLFLSNIEVRSSVSLANSLPKISAFGKEIANTMRSYGHITPDWALAGLAFGNGGPNDATSFKFEQRELSPVQSDIFFSSARMRTADHLRILDILEKLL
jgi:hypothetical protein